MALLRLNEVFKDHSHSSLGLSKLSGTSGTTGRDKERSFMKGAVFCLQEPIVLLI